MAPEGGDEEDGDAEEFESAEDHAEGEEDFADGRHEVIVHLGADVFESGADVVEGCGDGGDGGLERQAEGGHEQGPASEPHEVEHEKGVGGIWMPVYLVPSSVPGD